MHIQTIKRHLVNLAHAHAKKQMFTTANIPHTNTLKLILQRGEKSAKALKSIGMIDDNEQIIWNLANDRSLSDAAMWFVENYCL